ncbi:MAG TPA: hypothetical protein VE992_06200, partial [Solirubrobacteraceae bacterium]|nr:hypothetical protein [Solirubrobacteraceae bacterium]
LLLLGGGAGLLTLRARAPHAAALTASPESGGRWSLRAVRTWLRERPGQVGWTRLAAESLLILGLGTLLLAWAYSKHSPAWADRYLAVIVGPLILLFGLGLARGGRLAAVAVVLTACFWLLDPVPHNLNTKSNVASVAAQLRSTIGANALVLSTQPEQVPVLSFYLPAVEHWATPLGPVSDPHVVDWRNALEKLRASSVHAVLGPMIDKVKPGEKVVLITPVRFPTSPEWMALINTATARWGWFLSHDPDMRELASSNAYWYDAGVNVEATVYQRR